MALREVVNETNSDGTDLVPFCLELIIMPENGVNCNQEGDGHMLRVEEFKTIFLPAQDCLCLGMPIGCLWTSYYVESFLKVSQSSCVFVSCHQQISLTDEVSNRSFFLGR